MRRALWKKTFDLNEDMDEPGINLSLVECMLGDKDAARQVLQRVLFYSPISPSPAESFGRSSRAQEACAAP